MRVRVFASTERNYSIDRYTRELVTHFPPDIDAQAVFYGRSQGFGGRTWERYVSYPRLAAQRGGDINIIATETYSHLLFALPRDRTIVVCHDVHPLRDDVPGGLNVALYRARFRLSLHFLRAAWRVVTVSENTRRELLAHCSFLRPERVVAIPSGINEDWKRVEDRGAIQAFRAQHGLGNRRIVLNVGNDVWYKNVARAVNGFGGLTDRDLVFVHVGSLTAPTKAQMEEYGADRFVHLQNLSDDTLRLLYSTAELLVFPSLSEGFGWPPLEAMACGCPVIASDRGSLPEVCGDAALTVNPDADSIAAAMRQLLDSPQLRADLVRRGAPQVARFSWNNTASAILGLFADSVASR